jgi:hypothetical protein
MQVSRIIRQAIGRLREIVDQQERLQRMRRSRAVACQAEGFPHAISHSSRADVAH